MTEKLPFDDEILSLGYFQSFPPTSTAGITGGEKRSRHEATSPNEKVAPVHSLIDTICAGSLLTSPPAAAGAAVARLGKSAERPRSAPER
jgi:hypothetical protein